MEFEVETRNIEGQVTALGAAGPFTLVVDRPAAAGGGGLGFNGGELLYLAVAGCVSNDLFRETQAAGIVLRRVRVRVAGALVERVDAIAEIPNSLRRGTPVRLARTTVDPESSPVPGPAQVDAP